MPPARFADGPRLWDFGCPFAHFLVYGMAKELRGATPFLKGSIRGAVRQQPPEQLHVREQKQCPPLLHAKASDCLEACSGPPNPSRMGIVVAIPFLKDRIRGAMRQRVALPREQFRVSEPTQGS